MQPVRPEPLLSDEDYGAIEAAVMETARGRWFLAEYARRNRNADTEAVLASIRRLERLVKSAGNFEAQDEVTKGMADIAQAIAAAQILPAPQVRPADAALSEEAPQIEVKAADEQTERPVDTITPPNASEVEELPVVEEPVAEVAEPSHLAVVAKGEEMPPAPMEEAAASTEQNILPVTPEPQRDVVDELDAFLAEAAPEPTVEVEEVETVHVAPETHLPSLPEPFQIIELDEAATEALLTQDPPRHELILPSNHVTTQRWSRDVERETVETPPIVPPAAMEPLDTGLVTFIDEEPAEPSESVFTAPLRLEPDEAPEPDTMARQASTEHAMTLAEIEAMPFARKAALFS